MTRYKIVHVGLRAGTSEHDYDVLVEIWQKRIVYWMLVGLRHTAADRSVVHRSIGQHREWIDHLSGMLERDKGFIAALEREVELCAD